MDNQSRESLALQVRFRIGGDDVVAVLSRLIADRGIPESIQLENGPEFASRLPDHWACCNGMTLAFVRAGKVRAGMPTDSAVMEACSARRWQECPTESRFLWVADAHERVERIGRRPSGCYVRGMSGRNVRTEWGERSAAWGAQECQSGICAGAWLYARRK